MIKLVQFAISHKASVPNYSPFCVKVETLLRAMQVEFEIEAFRGNPGKFPKGKLPVIKDKDQLIEDSECIYDHLRQQGHRDLDAKLDPAQLAQSQAFKVMLEQSMCWIMVYQRWQDEANWQGYTKTALFGRLPAILRLFVPALVRKTVIKSLHGHGMGRFSKHQVAQLATKQLNALSVLLGEQDYFFGETLSSLDCCAFAVLSNYMAVEINPQLHELVKPYSNLIAFVARVKKGLY
jgi:glutathione S-transferase